MSVILDGSVDPAVAEAVRESLARDGLDSAQGVLRIGSPWWRAGVEDARERTPVGVGRARYDAAPPRSTRGATRA